MKRANKIIGSFEAKTHLSGLIDEVQSGAEYIITKRGKPVARLIPYRIADESSTLSEIIDSFDEIRKSVHGSTDIKSYINEGRKY
jgi:prevent-host-death family protein